MMVYLYECLGGENGLLYEEDQKATKVVYDFLDVCRGKKLRDLAGYDGAIPEDEGFCVEMKDAVYREQRYDSFYREKLSYLEFFRFEVETTYERAMRSIMTHNLEP